MSSYRNTKPYLNELIALAHKFIDAGIEDGEKVLDCAHKIGGVSLAAEFPSNNLLGSLIAVLQDQGINFALVGGVAVSKHGLLRQTEDIDAFVSKLPDMRDADYAARFGFYRAKSSTGTVMVIDHRTEGYVELLTPTSPSMAYALETATNHSVLGFSVPVIEADALIATKIHAMTVNPGREGKDSLDVIAVYKHRKPDLSRIRGLLTDAENQKLNEVLGIK